MIMSGRPTYEELEKRVKELEKFESERNQADQTYLESEDKYKNHSDATFEAIFLSEQGLCIGQNKSAERMFGYTFKEALGRMATDWIHPEYHSIVKQHIFSGDENSYEAVAIRKNGATFPCEIQGLMTVQKGKPIRVTALRDIIERKNAEKIMAEKERFLNSLLHAMPIPVFYKDREGIYQGFNKAYEAFMGKSRDQLIGKNVFDISQKELAQIYYAKDTELFDSGGIQHYETKVKNAKDEMRDVVFDKSVYTDNNGKIIGLIGTVSDITERKQAEEALREANTRHSSMIANIGDVIGIMGADGIMKYKSPNIEKWFGWKPEELIGTDGWETVYPEDLERIQKRFYALLEKDNASTTVEYRYKCKDDTYTWIELTAANRINDNTINGILLNYHDISERKNAENRVRDLSQMLMQAQEGERKMISCELHDSIAQDLSTLKLYCNRLFKKQSSSKSDTQGSPADVFKLIDQTITTVRDLAYELRPPNLDDLGLVYALEVFCEEFTEKNNTIIDFQAAGIHESTLNSDTQINLYRLVMEGLNNIRKHAAASKVIIRLVGAYPNIILRVEDNGRGFDIKEWEHSIPNRKRMGLRSMKERVNLLQGQMSIHSQLNKGAKIVIKLPLKDKQ